MTDNASALALLIDKDAIRNLIASYSDAISHRDAARAAATYAEDGQLTGMGQHIVGRAAIFKVLEGLMAAHSTVQQVAHSTLISVDGDRATARSTLYEIGSPVGTLTFSVYLASFEDEMERRPEGWRFAHRTLHVMGYSTIEAAKLHDTPDSLPTLRFPI